MRRTMRKTAGFLCALSLAAALCAGCAKSQSAGESGSRHAVITLLLLGDKPVNGRLDAALAEINKLLTARINSELRVQYIEWADWQNQYQLTLASGDSSIDLVITATDWLFAWEIVRKGGFYPLTAELLAANAPKTWGEVTPAHWDLCTQDGKIWFIPEDQYSQYTNHGQMWRLDWGREGGVTKITNYDDLEAYFDAVKKNHPEAYPWDISGQNADKGSGLLDGYFISNMNVQTIIGAFTGNFGIFFYDNRDPYTVVSPYMDGPEFAAAARMFDRWAKKGFWREDVLNYTGDTRELMKAGFSGSDQHHTGTYMGLRAQMDKEAPGSELQYFYWGMENKNVNKDLLTHGAMAVNGASKNVERALQVYDLLRNDQQIYTLYNFGVEGIDYIKDAAGVFDRPPGYNPSTDGLGSNFWGGRMDRFEPLWADQWSGRSGLLHELNSFARDYPLERFSFDNTKVQAEAAAIGDVCATHVTAITFGKTPDPERAAADFRAALRAAGYDKVKAELQAQLNAAKAAR